MERFALFVGINNYSNGITPLTCACNDAQELSFEFAANGYARDNIKLLLNDDGHCDGVEDELRKISERMEAGDLLIFYFAGHGRELHGEHFLIGPRGYADKKLFRRGSLAVSELISLTNKPGIRRLFILDCCRDNLLTSRSTTYVCENSRSIALDEAVKPTDDEKIIPPLILNSCSPGERAYEDSSCSHGFFTRTLLQTIAMPTLRKFVDLRHFLLENMNPPGEQHICWNGSVDSWDEVKLFKKWEDPCQTSQESAITEESLKAYYEAIAELEVWESKLNADKLSLPEDLLLLKRGAELAKDDGKYSLAANYLQQFIKGIRTFFSTVINKKNQDANAARIAEEYRQAEISGIIFSDDGKTVTGVRNKSKLINAIIPHGVTAIGKDAFSWCSNLISTTMPEGVTSIGNSAFKMCKKLRMISIPGSVTSIGEWAFWGTGLNVVNIPQKCSFIADGIKQSFPEKCTVIKCFSNSDPAVSTLSDLKLSEDGTVVVKAKNKKFMINAVIPEGVTEIGKGAFSWCSNLTSVIIPDGVCCIADEAFKMCRNLHSITIPDSVTSIGEWAFWRTGLTSVTIPEKCEFISDGVKASFPPDCIVYQK